MRTQSLLRPFWRLSFSFARTRRSSEWVYSNKADEMSHAKKGRIYISSLPGMDSYNCTMRMHKTLEESHIVMAEQPVETAKLLQAIAIKKRIIELTPQTEEKALQMVNFTRELVSFNRQEEKKRDFDFAMEQSKQLEMAVEVERINKSNNDRDNRLLKRQQEELNKYLETSGIRDKLDIYKKQNGFPRIVSLMENYSRISELRNGGINVFCFLDQNKALPSKALFNYLQQNSIPYEVLPSTSRLINLLAASGFPADRFAIEYFPGSMVAVLEKRKPMKMTIGVVQYRKNILSTMEAIRKVYGVDHMIYLESDAGKLVFRGRVSDFQNQSIDKLKGELTRVAVAPFISTFNEGLKEDRNKVERLYGQAMSDTTHFVRVQFINQQLKELLKRKDSRKVSITPMLQELIARVGREKAGWIAGDVLGVGRKEVEQLMGKAQRDMVMDHLGLQELTKKK